MKTPPYRFIFFIASLFALGLTAAAVTVPFSFSPGSIIKSEEVNANFTALETAVSDLESTIPGPAGTVGPNFSYLTDSTPVVVATVEIELPADGLVDLTSSGYLNLFHTNGTRTELWIGIVEDAAEITSLPLGTAITRVPASMPTDIWQYPFSVSRLVQKPAGVHSFSLVGYRASGSDPLINVARPLIRAVYYPKSHAAAGEVTGLTVNDGPIVGRTTH